MYLVWSCTKGNFNGPCVINYELGTALQLYSKIVRGKVNTKNNYLIYQKYFIIICNA